MQQATRPRANVTVVEGQVIPLEWGADDAIVRVGVLVFDTDEEIELTGKPFEFLEDLVDSYVRIEGQLMTGTRGGRVLRVDQVEFVDEDPFLDEFEDDYDDDY